MKSTGVGKEPKQSVLIVSTMGKWGECNCGGTVHYYSDFGVRCGECNKLYGTWVENLRKSKEEERRRREEIARRIEIKKFDDELLI